MKTTSFRNEMATWGARAAAAAFFLFTGLVILFGGANVGAGVACWYGIRAQQTAVAVQTQVQLDRCGRRDLLPAVAGLQGHWLVRFRH